jgi:hypothetical protein
MPETEKARVTGIFEMANLPHPINVVAGWLRTWIHPDPMMWQVWMPVNGMNTSIGHVLCPSGCLEMRSGRAVAGACPKQLPSWCCPDFVNEHGTLVNPTCEGPM